MKIGRIMHIIPTLEGGGAERQLSYLAPKLVEKGWDVHIALLRLGMNYERIRGSGVKIHLIPYRSHYDPSIIWRFYKLILRIDPDIIQTWLPMADIFGGVAANMAGKTWVLSERCQPNTSSLRPLLTSLRIWLGRKYSRAIVANSATGSAYWQLATGRDRHVRVIRNSLPIEEINGVKAKEKCCLGLSQDQDMVLYAGRFSEQKNVNNLTEALVKVLEKRDAFAFLCGDGPLLGQVQTLVRKFGVQDRIILKGYVNDIWAWMKAADVFVSVSFYEGMPNTVMEAMACGCPLVLSDIPEHRELLDDESTLFVNPLDPDDIASAIGQCLQNKDAASNRAKLARAAVKGWTPDSTADQYIRFYNEILESST